MAQQQTHVIVIKLELSTNSNDQIVQTTGTEATQSIQRKDCTCQMGSQEPNCSDENQSLNPSPVPQLTLPPPPVAGQQVVVDEAPVKELEKKSNPSSSLKQRKLSKKERKSKRLEAFERYQKGNSLRKLFETGIRVSEINSINYDSGGPSFEVRYRDVHRNFVDTIGRRKLEKRADHKLIKDFFANLKGHHKTKILKQLPRARPYLEGDVICLD